MQEWGLPAADEAPVNEAEGEGLQGAAEAVDGQLHAPRLLLQQRCQSPCAGTRKLSGQLMGRADKRAAVSEEGSGDRNQTWIRTHARKFSLWVALFKLSD